MVILGAGVGAGIGAASVSSGDTAAAVAGGAVAGAVAGYAIGHGIVERMDRQEKKIRLSDSGRRGDIRITRLRPDKLKISLEREAQFAIGSPALTPSARRALDTVAQAIRGNGPSRLIIRVYASEAPSRKANLILSRRRARAVADYLLRKGVGGGIRTVGKGSPILLPADEKARQKPYYRRIEILIQGVNA